LWQENGKMMGKIEAERETFNEHAKPPKDSIWSTHATHVHGLLHKHHPKVIDAHPIETVWEDFEKK